MYERTQMYMYIVILSLNELHSLLSNILQQNVYWTVGIARNMQTEGPSKGRYSTAVQKNSLNFIVF